VIDAEGHERTSSVIVSAVVCSLIASAPAACGAHQFSAVSSGDKFADSSMM
jgi:hypothetical protein